MPSATAQKPSPPSEHPLRVYRQEKGLALEAIARAADTTRATIYRIETGKLKPTFDLLRRVVAACHGEVTADQILAWQPPDNATP